MSKICLAPWVHTYVYPDGTVSPCCQAIDENLEYEPYDCGPLHKNSFEPYNCGSLHKNSLTEIWNSENYKKLRRDLITKGESEICNQCYKVEDSGNDSMRLFFNSNFNQHIDKIKMTKSDGTFDKVNIVYWDFRLTNTCNFKCRMCSPLFSSSWQSEMDRNTNTDFYNDFYTYDNEKNEIPLNSIDIDNFLDENNFLFDIVEEIYFAGGEPLIMEEHYKILKKIINLKKTNICITYNTNFSTIKYKNVNIFDLWSIFKNVEIGISVDGIGERGELIRSGFNWNKFVNNFYAFKDRFPDNNPQITPTIQVLNCLHICDLEKKLFELGIINNFDQFQICFLLNPDYLSVLILPDFLKHQVCKKVDDHIKYFLIPNNVSEKHLELWESFKKFIWSEDHQHLIPKFLKYTEGLDIIRNENTKETFPELSELWQ
jgi:MoaA/NifB/PqqE/SkfB family radical SAM enzyme